MDPSNWLFPIGWISLFRFAHSYLSHAGSSQHCFHFSSCNRTHTNTKENWKGCDWIGNLVEIIANRKERDNQNAIETNMEVDSFSAVLCQRQAFIHFLAKLFMDTKFDVVGRFLLHRDKFFSLVLKVILIQHDAFLSHSYFLWICEPISPWISTKLSIFNEYTIWPIRDAID